MEFEDKVMNTVDQIENNARLKHPFELFGIEHGYGWYGLTLPIIEEIRKYNIKHPNNEISITQIKEKMGHLEIYTSPITDDLHKMILKAGFESEHICEICGARGKLTKIKGWYKTLCKDHYEAKRKSQGDSKLEDRIYKNLLNIEDYGWKVHNHQESKIFSLPSDDNAE